ncbi:MAG: hypothetical protein ACK51N_04880 [bacterium]|jgi:hypothetical protein
MTTRNIPFTRSDDHPNGTCDPAYGDPMQYDALAAPFVSAAARALLKAARHLGHDPARSLFFEPACGTAPLLRALRPRVGGVAGYDRSEAMLRAAVSIEPLLRRRLFRADLSQERLAHPAAIEGTVQVAFCLDNTIRHLHTARQLRTHLGHMARLLAPETKSRRGGIYVVGIGLLRSDEFVESETIETGRLRYADRRLLVRQITTFVPHPPSRRFPDGREVAMTTRLCGEQTALGRYTLACWSPERFLGCVKAAGLHLRMTMDDRGRPCTLTPGYCWLILGRIPQH